MKKEILNVNTSNCHSGLDPEPKATPYGGSEERGMSDSEQSHEMLNQVQHDRIMEQGRSMVEMLGVLAVVGLLSVMAFAGFRIALNKHYANEILNEANKRAVIVAGQIGFNQGTPSLSEFSNNTFTGGTFDSSVTTNPQTESFALKVSNVPEAVCEQILTMIDEHTMVRRLSSESSMAQTIEDCSVPEGNYLMVYNDDLQGQMSDIGYCDTVVDCQTACAICKNNVCTNECEIAPTTCTSNDECASAGVCAGCVKAEGAETGTCQYACEELEYLESDGNQYIDTGWYVDYQKDITINGSFLIPETSGRRCIIGNIRTESSRAPERQQDLNLEIAGGPKIRMYEACGTVDKKTATAPIQTKIAFDFSYHATSGVSSISCYSDNFTSTKQDTQQVEGVSLNTSKLFKDGRSNIFGGITIYEIIISNGTLIRDFIPVLDPNGTPAMLDRVEPKLYYNQGTGQFSYGRKPQP